MYPDRGVDLEVAAGAALASPFAGVLYGETGDRVTIKPDGSSFETMELRITNLRSTLKPGEKRKVYAGDALGQVTSTRCVNHIHVAMSDGGTPVDPTRYLPRQNEALGKWIQTCDEYKLVYMVCAGKHFPPSFLSCPEI